MKQFKLFPCLAGLTLCMLALAPNAAVVQDAGELKAELQAYGFQNSETVLDWLINSDHERPFHSEANYPGDYQDERGTGLDPQGRYQKLLLPVVSRLGIRPVVVDQVIGAVGIPGLSRHPPKADIVTNEYTD